MMEAVGERKHNLDLEKRIIISLHCYIGIQFIKIYIKFNKVKFIVQPLAQQFVSEFGLQCREIGIRFSKVTDSFRLICCIQ
jgi:hypothetical protein